MARKVVPMELRFLGKVSKEKKENTPKSIMRFQEVILVLEKRRWGLGSAAAGSGGGDGCFRYSRQ